MCGITAFLGNESAYPFLLSSLKALQNRGYDSAGISTIDCNNQIITTKFASTSQISAISCLEKMDEYHSGNKVGIGHTRWATHGKKLEVNSHPHSDNLRRISLVHNGIIENYSKIKERLIKKNYLFLSNTDTEVIAVLIGYHLDQGEEILKAIMLTLSDLEGSWALAIIYRDEPNKIFLAKNGSPLLIGAKGQNLFVSSEKSGFLNYADRYFPVKDEEIIVLSSDSEERLKGRFLPLLEDEKELGLGSNPTWTWKEIHEQPDCLIKLVASFEGQLSPIFSKIKSVDNIIILGCGSSYYAGMVGYSLLKKLKIFNTVSILDGSDFHEEDIPKMGTTLLICLSQSGETKDLYRAFPIAKERGVKILSIVNVKDSLIYRESDFQILLQAGKEVAVASTKSFTSQITFLTLLALKLDKKETDLAFLPQKVSLSLQLNNEVKRLAEKIYQKEHLFILGKGKYEAIAKEGALKIKEISYIHAEGYSASALKHGPFALIEEGTPIFLIITEDEDKNKMINVAEEVKCRNAHVIAITDIVDLNPSLFDDMLILPSSSYFHILSILPFQLLAYNLADLKEINPDFPRNLAKVVTVE